MRALTLWQPWASLIAEGVKTIETRSWRAPDAVIGERIAIHAAARDTDNDQTIPSACWDALGERIGGAAPPHGAVVATARLTACVPMVPIVHAVNGVHPFDHNGEHRLFVHDMRDELYETNMRGGPPLDRSGQLPFGHFEPGRWAWLLADIEKLPEPVPAKGRQKLWEWAA